ncbi:hypothetical protein FQA39_LY05462 [Lamprigera yunnana]|nr:hypothetical protein FQA39_LY05462 [Lamprigera yunnana]
MEADKRERGSNFTEQDKEILINLVTNSNIFCLLESKRTDAVHVKQKNETWNLVAEQFNGISTNQPRSGMQLKSAYNNYKRKLKKDKADDKAALYRTGGGPSVPVKESESQAILSAFLYLIKKKKKKTDVVNIKSEIENDILLIKKNKEEVLLQTFKQKLDQEKINLEVENEILFIRKAKEELYIGDHSIISSKCQCPRGLDQCHHTCAVAFFGHYYLEQ